MSYATFYKKYPVPTGLLITMGLFYTIASMCIGFLGDDWRYLYELQKTGNPFDYILHPYTTAFAWRPLSDLSWVINFYLSGTHAVGYHIVNLAIFFATAVVMLKVLRALIEERIAVWVTTLFCIMPTHFETILWISGRTDSLALLFCLLSLRSYIAWRKQHHWKYLATSATLYLLGVLTKESILLAPLLFCAVDFLFLTHGKEWKRIGVALLPFIGCIALFVALRFAVIGGVVSNDHTFTQNYSLLPTLTTLTDAARGLTFVVNESTAANTMRAFPTIWKWVVLPLLAIVLFALALMQRIWKKPQTIILGIVTTLLLLAPVFSLVEYMTPDLKHMRFLYAPSFGIALMLGAVVATQAGRYTHRIQIAVSTCGIALCLVANSINVIPWLAASSQTQDFLKQFAVQYPELMSTQEPTVVYMLHTPSEYRGAYLFHDYYSLQQAMRQYARNTQLTVQTAGVKAAEPAPYCDDSQTTAVHVMSWNGSTFENRDELIAAWEREPQHSAITLDRASAWKQHTVRGHDLEYHFEEDRLVLDQFGEHPQIQITLPEGSSTRDWSTVALATDTRAPLQLHWNTPKTAQTTFNTIAFSQTEEQRIALCGYPNWIVGGNVYTIQLSFPARFDQAITLTSLRLY